MDNQKKNKKIMLIVGLITLILMVFSLFLRQSNNQNMSELSKHYKLNNDFSSLKKLVNYLEIETTRNDVELLLGEPIYSPAEGQVYYSSESHGFFDGCMKGAVLEYRTIKQQNGNIQITITNKLENKYIGSICE